MQVNPKGLEILKQFEDLSLKAYPDPGSADGNPWTIGYGHTNGVTKGDECTVEQAEQWLREDLAEFESGVANAVKVALNDNQFSALVLFAYNVGLGKLKTSTLLKLLNAGNYSGAANEFHRWNKNDGQVMAGLTRRRQAEKDLFES